jgi:hypothetical protein
VTGALHCTHYGAHVPAMPCFFFTAVTLYVWSLGLEEESIQLKITEANPGNQKSLMEAWKIFEKLWNKNTK